MLQEMTIFGKIWMIMLLVSLTSAAPMSDATNITLKVEPRVLETHRITISIEPLMNYTEAADTPGEFLDEEQHRLQENGPFENPKQQSIKTASSSSSASHGETKASHVSPTRDFEMDVFDSNSSLTSGNGNTTTMPLTRLAIKTANSRPGGIDINKFVITVPDIQCPPGYKLDVNGHCREVYGNNRHGWDRSNFLAIDEQARSDRKYLGKLIRY